MKALSIFFIFIFSPIFIISQDSEHEKKHKFSFEHNYGLQFLSHSEFASDGSASPESLRFKEFLQFASDINFMYQNKYVNAGIGTTTVIFTPKVQYTRISPMNLFYDVYLRLGLDFGSLVKNTNPDFRVGPYITIGAIRPTFSVYYANYNCSLGLEMYTRNFRFSASIGFYNFDKEEKAKQNLSSYYNSNNIIALKMGWCLPNRYSERKSERLIKLDPKFRLKK